MPDTDETSVPNAAGASEAAGEQGLSAATGPGPVEADSQTAGRGADRGFASAAGLGERHASETECADPHLDGALGASGLPGAPDDPAAGPGPRDKHRRGTRVIVAVTLLGVLVAALIPWTLLSQGQGAGVPATAQVTRGDFTASVDVTGTTDPLSSTYVSSRIEGVVHDVKVSPGDHVDVGDTLLSIQNDQIDQALQDAQSTADAAQAAYDQARSEADSAYAAFESAVAAWNSATSAEEQQRLTDPRTLEDGVTSAQQAAADAKSALDAANQALASAQAQAGARVVAAPVAGTVIALDVADGSSFKATPAAFFAGRAWGPVERGAAAGPRPDYKRAVDGSWLVRIGDVSQLRLAAQASGAGAQDVQAGQKATVTFGDAPDLTLTATVEQVTPASGADAGTVGVGGGASRTVVVRIDNPDSLALPDWEAHVSIETAHVDDALIVPLGALDGYDADAKTATVTVVTLDEKGRAKSSESRAVTVKAVNETQAAVEGVSEGETVVIAHQVGAGSEADEGAAGSDPGSAASEQDGSTTRFVAA